MGSVEAIMMFVSAMACSQTLNNTDNAPSKKRIPPKAGMRRGLLDLQRTEEHLCLDIPNWPISAMSQGISGNGMDKATKQYRQYIFKVNHKLARKSNKQGQPQDKANMKVKGMLRAASKVPRPLLKSPSPTACRH